MQSTEAASKRISSIPPEYAASTPPEQAAAGIKPPVGSQQVQNVTETAPPLVPEKPVEQLPKTPDLNASDIVQRTEHALAANTDDHAAFEEYLRRYPNGDLAPAARTRLGRLKTLSKTHPVRTFPAGIECKAQGIVISRDSDTVLLRGDDDAIGAIDLTKTTKMYLTRSFGRKTRMNSSALIPGIRIEAQGTGNDKGELVAEKVTFDPNSMRAKSQVDEHVNRPQ